MKVRMLNRILFCVLSFLSVTSCSDEKKTTKSENMSLLQNKPVFTIRLSGFGSRYDVILNGIDIYREKYVDAQLDTEFPANQYMHPKINTLTLRLVPNDAGEKINPHARVTLELLVRDLKSDKTYTVADIVYKAGEKYLENTKKLSLVEGGYDSASRFERVDSGDVELGEVIEIHDESFEGAFGLERKITIPNSLPLWKFFESDKLPDYYTISDEKYYAARSEIYKELEFIQNALSEGTAAAINRIMPMFEERSSETDAAFYLPEGETLAGLKADFMESIQSPTQTLAELKEDYVDIEMEPNRFLVFLRRGNGLSAIGFNDSEFDGSNGFPIKFRRENGKWIIAR